MTLSHMTEAKFWASFKNGMSRFKQLHMTRVENSTGSGVSDVTACYEGREAWLELKVFKGNRIHFRSSQRTWIDARLAAGGRIWIVARYEQVEPPLIELYDPAEVFKSEYKVEVPGKSFSIKRVDLPQPELTLKKPYDWDRLLTKIFWNQ